MIDVNEIFAATNGGLDIIQQYYPNANPNKQFKLREEKTASAALKKIAESNVYVLTDFGGDNKSKNALHICSEIEGITYAESIFLWANKLGLIKESSVLKPKIEKLHLSDLDFEFEEGEKYHFETRDFTKEELRLIGPIVKQEHCQRYQLYALKFYAKKDETKVTKIYSTDTYPIFVFINKQIVDGKSENWYKIYQPKAQDKKYRFFYVNGKPSDFIFGLSYVEKKYNKNLEDYEIEKEADKNTSLKPKLDRIIIGSGDRDSLNLASTGEFVIWFNSESQEITPTIWKKLINIAEDIVLVPDIDTTGVRTAVQKGLEYLTLKIAWLPSWLRKSKDFRGYPKKDFTDFAKNFQYNHHQLTSETKKLIDNALHMQFWTSHFNTKTEKTNYYFDNVSAYHFLNCNGFYRMESLDEKEGYIYVRVQKHIVEKIKYTEVKAFFNHFLEEKQRELGSTYISNSLRNMMYNSPKLSENSLSNLTKRDFKFKDYTKHSQVLFFKEKVWQITADKISETVTDNQNYVWHDNILENKVKKLYDIDINPKKIKIEEPFFKITKDKLGDLDIEILENNCDYLNFMINTSRMFWSKEIIDQFNTVEEQEKYRLNNLFKISSPNLTAAENYEQKLHLISKIFALGYISHKHKDKSKPWIMYAMDNKVGAEGESHGGTGKSVFTGTPMNYLDGKSLGARNPKIWENKHIFDGVTEHTDYFLFNDANQWFKLDNLYTVVTDDLDVNPKNSKPYTISFKDSPKFSISTNYTPRELDPSTMRRLLFVAFSDYYHHGGDHSEYENSRIPYQDFGYNLFSGWGDDQWNKFYNLIAQCIQFYLSCNEKLDAPTTSVLKRTLEATIGPVFMEWADNYITPKLNTEFQKNEALDQLKASNKSVSNIGSNAFKSKLKAYCQFKDYDFNPKEYATQKDGRIMRNIMGETVEYIYIKSTDNDQIQEQIKNDLPY